MGTCSVLWAMITWCDLAERHQMTQVFAQAVLIVSRHTRCFPTGQCDCGHVLCSKHRWLGLLTLAHSSGHERIWWWRASSRWGAFFLFVNIHSFNLFIMTNGSNKRATVNWGEMCSRGLIYQQILACPSCHIQVSGNLNNKFTLSVLNSICCFSRNDCLSAK